ncbi:HNH endonuclease [Skermania sp. ID1734]|nr:HNH endonuclease [Skermania sp. ID1734]
MRTPHVYRYKVVIIGFGLLVGTSQDLSVRPPSLRRRGTRAADQRAIDNGVEAVHKRGLQEAVENSTSVAGVLRYLGRPLAGGTHAHVSRQIRKFGIDTSHFTGQAHNKGKTGVFRRRWEEILVLREVGSARTKPHLLRRALIEAGTEYKCAVCGLSDYWNDGPLTLHVDHIDGNYVDSRKENLRFICPNCHSQTANWAGRNRWRQRQGADSDDDSVA